MQQEKIFTRRHENRDDLAGEYKWGDAGQLILLLIFIIAVIIDKQLLKISDFFSVNLPVWLRISLGLIFVLLGSLLAHQGLKVVFSQQRQVPQVISQGVFALVRHPIYLGSILTYLGVLFFFYSLSGDLLSG